MAEDIAFAGLTKEDLEDPRLAKLNAEISFLYEQIAAMQGASGPYVFRKPFKAVKIELMDTKVPEDDTGVLSLGAAKELFSGRKIRDSFDARAWLGEPVRGLSGGGGTGGGGPVYALFD